MMVVIPDNLNPAYANNATIWITGGSNESGDGTGVPGQDDLDMEIITTLSTGIGMPFAGLFEVPY